MASASDLSKKRKSSNKNLSKKQKGSRSTFPQDLYDMVDATSSNSLISWGCNNDSFIIWDPQKVKEHLLNMKFKSFTKKLNHYGFKRVKRDPRHGDRPQGSLEYEHEGFIRNRKELLYHIVSRKRSSSRFESSNATEDGDQGNRIVSGDEKKKNRSEDDQEMKDVGNEVVNDQEKINVGNEEGGQEMKNIGNEDDDQEKKNGNEGVQEDDEENKNVKEGQEEQEIENNQEGNGPLEDENDDQGQEIEEVSEDQVEDYNDFMEELARSSPIVQLPW